MRLDYFLWSAAAAAVVAALALCWVLFIALKICLAEDAQQKVLWVTFGSQEGN